MKRGREQSLARVMVPTQSAYVLAARQKPQSGCGLQPRVAASATLG